MTFKAILQAIEEEGAKFYRCYTKFLDFYSEKMQQNSLVSNP